MNCCQNTEFAITNCEIYTIKKFENSNIITNYKQYARQLFCLISRPLIYFYDSRCRLLKIASHDGVLSQMMAAV